MWKIAVQIHIVFVYTPQPRHSVWIENMNDDEGGVGRQRRNIIE